ncbi:ABC transporter substrate-binding protein [Streptomyces rapamycinicus]|uniref:NitT/TauT family transport system substrate-binding protein n=1 Tax=Streptomyces rapamycinicus TaxID=1226757 RepID=A0ABR6LZL4_9ACTN|nr:ABC transporter substrate-binding protein [Streptomyces rapamycinicus]MBB4787792.1 NitT/TauT family transport system substrate-binding protein [Streptomyces rapamycinicus]UTP36553.1 ABC transporter substrate-binding protein [Streptomyces rapamycinicus NRRL 5491]
MSLAVLLIIPLAACAKPEKPSRGGVPSSVTIGYQQSVMYVPLLVMKEKGWLKNQFPKTDMSFTQLASGAAIRDGMLSGDIDIGMIGVGAFNVGRVRGLDWKYMMSNADLDASIMVKDPAITSFEKLAARNPRISTIAPDSPQAFMVKLAAKRKLGDGTALDERFATLDAPSAVQALKAGQIDADTATSPSLYLEEAFGARPVLKSSDVFPAGLLGVGPVARSRFKDRNQVFAKGFVRQLARAVRWVEDHPDEALKLVSDELFGPSANHDLLLRAVRDQPWTVTPHGVGDYSKSSAELGLTEKSAPENQSVYADLLKVAQDEYGKKGTS